MDSELAGNTTDYYSLEISLKQFEKISGLVYQIAGIDLHEGKEELVKARLIKRLRHLKLSNFERYIKYLNDDKSGEELRAMVDVLTTNKTNFFRESEHLDFLRDKVIPNFGRGPIRIWSAGCSSGEEPYSIAIVLCEEIPDIAIRDIRILATDISDRMMEKARKGIYDGEAVKTLPPLLKQKYFESSYAGSRQQNKVSPMIQSMISFAKLNLMEEWPMRGPFEAIFCRNVMIYFDKPTQERLVGRFWSMLREGGYLFVGHSESLTFLKHEYRYLQPAVYQKVKPSEADQKKRAGIKGK